jgi:hypothetical protein
MVPSHLSTVLFAMAAAEPEEIAHRVRFANKLSYAIGLPVVAVLVLGSHWILSIYGPGYARVATIPMALVALGYIPSVPKALYIAICRANGRTTFVAVLLSVFTVVEIGGAVVGGIYDGLNGLAAGIFISLVAQGLYVTPPILRVILPRHAQPSTAPRPVISYAEHKRTLAQTMVDLYQLPTGGAVFSGTAENQTAGASRPGYDLAELAGRGSVKERQDAGINALITLAQSVSTTGGFGRIP